MRASRRTSTTDRADVVASSQHLSFFDANLAHVHEDTDQTLTVIYTYHITVDAETFFSRSRLRQLCHPLEPQPQNHSRLHSLNRDDNNL